MSEEQIADVFKPLYQGQLAAVQDFINNNSELEDEEVVFPDNQPSGTPPAHLLESAKKGEPEPPAGEFQDLFDDPAQRRAAASMLNLNWGKPSSEPQEPSAKEGEPEPSSEPQEEGTELDDSWLRGAEAIRAEVLLERILDGGTEHYVHLVLSDEGCYLVYPDTTTCQPSSQPSSSSSQFQGPIERSAAQHQPLEPKRRKFIPSLKLQSELYKVYCQAIGYHPEEDSELQQHMLEKSSRFLEEPPKQPASQPPQHLLEKSPRFLEELPKQPASQPPQHLLAKTSDPPGGLAKVKKSISIKRPASKPSGDCQPIKQLKNRLGIPVPPWAPKVRASSRYPKPQATEQHSSLLTKVPDPPGAFGDKVFLKDFPEHVQKLRGVQALEVGLSCYKGKWTNWTEMPRSVQTPDAFFFYLVVLFKY